MSRLQVQALARTGTGGVAAEEAIVEAPAKATGVIKNLKAHKAMNHAIIAAREQPDSHVRWLGPRTAAVRSRKVAGAECSVRLPEGDGRTEVECNCRAGRRHDMCWHVAKVLQLGGATEKQLLQHLGLYLGSSRGGYWKLQEAMRADAAPGGGQLQHARGQRPALLQQRERLSAAGCNMQGRQWRAVLRPEASCPLTARHKQTCSQWILVRRSGTACGMRTRCRCSRMTRQDRKMRRSPLTPQAHNSRAAPGSRRRQLS